MSVKKTISIVLVALLCCGVFYFFSNLLKIHEFNLPAELRVIHFYDETPGASRDVLFDEVVLNQAAIAEVMDELEGNYLHVPVDADFFGVDKEQYQLCISGAMGVCKDIDIRDNGYVLIDGKAYVRLGGDTEELYYDLMDEFKGYIQ